MGWLKELVHDGKLARLHARRRRIQSRYRRERVKALPDGSVETDLSETYDNERAELLVIDDEIRVEMTEYWVGLADRLGVPMPRYAEERAWEQSERSGQSVLSVRALNDLRSAVRKEQSDRWQFWELRIRLISLLLTGLTGVIGTLIGLVAIWRGSR
jgi:hypothetical protein